MQIEPLLRVRHIARDTEVTLDMVFPKRYRKVMNDSCKTPGKGIGSGKAGSDFGCVHAGSFQLIAGLSY